MSLPALATTDDIADRLGRDLTDTEETQCERLLAYASALIRSYKGHATWVNDEGELEDVPDGVPEVCTEMVFRAIQNPTGATQDTAGPFSVSFGSDAAQRIYLTRADKMILRSPGGAFTIDPTPAGATDFSTGTSNWLDDEAGFG